MLGFARWQPGEGGRQDALQLYEPSLVLEEITNIDAESLVSNVVLTLLVVRKFFRAICLHSGTFHANFFQMATLTTNEKLIKLMD